MTIEFRKVKTSNTLTIEVSDTRIVSLVTWHSEYPNTYVSIHDMTSAELGDAVTSLLGMKAELDEKAALEAAKEAKPHIDGPICGRPDCWMRARAHGGIGPARHNWVNPEAAEEATA